MKEDFINWLNFHAEILNRYKITYFLWGIGMVLMPISQYLYPQILKIIYNFQIFSQYIFRKFVEENINYLVHGLWVIPLIIFMFFFIVGLKIHQENIEKIYKY
jgi:hypothetical protein